MTDRVDTQASHGPLARPGDEVPPSRLELQIDRLVIHGGVEVDPTSIGAAIERELVRLLETGRVNDPRSREIDRRAVEVRGSLTADRIAASIAEVVADTLE